MANTNLSLWVHLSWRSHINRIIRCIVFDIWFLLFSIIFSKFIMLHHVWVLHSFFGLNHVPLYRHTMFCLSNHQLMDISTFSWIHSFDGFLFFMHCFHFLATVNNAALNTHVQVFVQMYFFNSLG